MSGYRSGCVGECALGCGVCLCGCDGADLDVGWNLGLSVFYGKHFFSERIV